MKMIRLEGESDLTGEEGSIGGFDPWVISLSFCLTLGLVGFILQYLMDINVLELTNFKDRAIGIAVLSGVDTALRTKLYVEFVIGAIVSLFILLVLFDYISNKYLKSIPVSFEKQMIFYTSLFALASMFLYVTSRQILFLNNLKLLGFLTILLSLFILLKLIADRMRWEGITLAFSNSTVISISLIFPFFSYITGLVLLNKSLSFVNDIYHYMILSFLWISFLAIYCVLNIAANKMNRSNVLLSNLVALSFLPILLIPITIPLSNELQFTLSGIVHISPRIISVSIAAFLLLLSLILFIVFSKRDIYVPQSIKVLENAYFPIIIASAILFRNYQHFLVFDVYDMFHHGELLISNQQLFSFGSMPYVGIYPTKGLSEMYYQILYSLVNGYGPVEPLLWSWITPLIGSILLYFIRNCFLCIDDIIRPNIRYHGWIWVILLCNVHFGCTMPYVGSEENDILKVFYAMVNNNFYCIMAIGFRSGCICRSNFYFIYNLYERIINEQLLFNGYQNSQFISLNDNNFYNHILYIIRRHE